MLVIFSLVSASRGRIPRHLRGSNGGHSAIVREAEKGTPTGERLDWMIPTNPWFLRIFLESMNLRLTGEGLCSFALSTCPCGPFLYELHEGSQEI